MRGCFNDDVIQLKAPVNTNKLTLSCNCFVFLGYNSELYLSVLCA